MFDVKGLAIGEEGKKVLCCKCPSVFPRFGEST